MYLSSQLDLTLQCYQWRLSYWELIDQKLGYMKTDQCSFVTRLKSRAIKNLQLSDLPWFSLLSESFFVKQLLRRMQCSKEHWYRIIRSHNRYAGPHVRQLLYPNHSRTHLCIKCFSHHHPSCFRPFLRLYSIAGRDSSVRNQPHPNSQYTAGTEKLHTH